MKDTVRSKFTPMHDSDSYFVHHTEIGSGQEGHNEEWEDRNYLTDDEDYISGKNFEESGDGSGHSEMEDVENSKISHDHDINFDLENNRHKNIFSTDFGYLKNYQQHFQFQMKILKNHRPVIKMFHFELDNY